jgi:pyridoxine/pyridoxamine 5'-phosphate oxidase
MGLDGTVNARTLVLRAVDKHANQFQIYTDARSSKAEEITQQKNAMFVFWSKKLNWQLRVRVNVMDMDWLELASSGHRRAKISLDTWTWLTP